MSSRPAHVLLALLTAAYVAGYVDSASIQDTSRDLWHAWAIRHGVHFPLEGPVLGGPVGGAMHLGPAWYYVLALPLWLHESWLAAALFTGLVAGLKFPLAYACGSRLGDRELGLLWAACLAAPGWSSIETLIFFNPNPASAVVLLALLLALRVGARAPRGWESAAFGLSFSLALHVHPTTAPVGILAVAFVASAKIGNGSPARTLALMAAGFALPLAPYIASQAAQGFPDAATTAAHASERIRAANLLGAPAVLASQLAFGPFAMARLAGAAQPLAFALAAASTLLVVLALGAAARRGASAQLRAAVAGLAFLALLSAGWIALLRATTPEYFLYPLAPFTAGLAALGLRGLCDFRTGRIAAAAMAALLAAAGLAVMVRVAATVRHGEGVLSSQVLDVKRIAPDRYFAETWFPASGRAALGRFLCARRDGVAVHGHLAFVVDRGVGVEALLACGTKDHVTVGGDDPSRPHWVGLSRRFWSRIDARGACRLGSLELVQASKIVSAGPGLAIPDGRRYFPRPHAAAAAAPRELAFEAPAGHAVLVTNVLHGYEGFGAIRASVGGVEVSPTAANDLSALFGPAAGDRSAQWVLSFEATSAPAIDVVTFPARPAQSAQAECR